MLENSLSIFNRGSQMLAEANTIQKARDLKDLALTAADWARRIGAGEAAIQHARAYAFEAEHKMGEMLAETDRAQGKRTDLVRADDHVNKPTLSEIGISKNESSRAQKIAALPQEVFAKVKAGEIPVSKAIETGLRIDKTINAKDCVKIVEKQISVSWAMAYADLAIENLEKIQRTDKKRTQALEKVKLYCEEELNEHSENC